MRHRRKDLHLPRCVYRKHGAYWFVRNNKWTRLGRDLGTALAEYARLHAQRTGGMVALIEEAMPYVLRDVRGKPVSKGTEQSYRKAAKKLQGILEEFAPHEVTHAHVVELHRGLHDTPVAANQALSVLRKVFEYAVIKRYVDFNPTIGVKQFPTDSRDRLISPDEFRAIYDKAGPRLRVMMEIAYLTGQRIMDVATIARADIRAEGIYFRQAKTDAQLLVAWSPELRAAVDRANALTGNVRGMSLFRTRFGTTPSYGTVRDEWKAACEKAGIADTTLRDIRAMSATEAKRQGLDPTALLGHTSERMTRRYLRGREVPVVTGPTFKEKAK